MNTLNSSLVGAEMGPRIRIKPIAEFILGIEVKPKKSSKVIDLRVVESML